MEFAKIYAPPRLYADLLGLPLASVHASLRDAAISRLDFPGMGQTFLVRRDEAIRRLGAEWDLERGGVGPRFWQEFRDHLRSVGSANKLVGGVGCTAGVRSGDASIYATVRVLPAKSAIELEFSAERRTSPTRFNALLEILPEVKATWHNVACRFDEPAGVVRLIEAFRYTEGLSSSRARDIANRIDMRLTALRHRVKHAGRSPSRAAQA